MALGKVLEDDPNERAVHPSGEPADDREVPVDIGSMADDLLDLPHVAISVGERRTLRTTHHHEEEPTIVLGDQLVVQASRWEEKEYENRQGHHRQRPDQHRGAVVDRPPEQRSVPLGQRVEAALEHLEQLTMRMRHAEDLGAEHRGQGERHEPRDDHGASHCDAKLAEESARGSTQESQWCEYRDEGDRRRDHGEPDFVRPVCRRKLRRFVQLLLVPEGVLQHDDRVVHHDADGDREREQREVVDREAEEIHDRERRHDRRRNREPGDHRRPQVAQEHEDDQYHEDRRDEQRETRIVDRVRDELRSVVCGLELHARRQGLLDAGQRFANVARHIDQVRLGLAHHADRDGRRPIVTEDRPIIFRPQLDPRDVLELYELGALAGHGQLAEFPRGLELAQRPNGELAPSRFDPARGDFDVARDDRVLDVLHGEPARRQGVGLYPDAHRVAPLPEDAGAADAREALKPCLHEPIGDVGELHQVVVLAAERQPEEWLRVGRLLRDHGLEYVDREAPAHARHLVAYVLRGDVDGPVEVELQGDLAVLLRRGARERAQSLDRRELLFEHVGHRGFHHLRVGARQGRGDRDDRRVDVRELAHGQSGVADDAEQDECRRDHARQHRPPNRRFRELHRARKLSEWVAVRGRGAGCPEIVDTSRPFLRRLSPLQYDTSTAPTPACFTGLPGSRRGGWPRCGRTPAPRSHPRPPTGQRPS